MTATMNDAGLHPTLTRCPWLPPNKPLYQHYHDHEWGVPVHDDQRHFEMLVLEGAQAGLSWETVLNKREGYRATFYQFDPARVAAMSDAELELALQNPEIVRNRLKVFSARRNAQVFLAIQQEFGSFDAYVWPFVGGQLRRNAWKSLVELPARTAESDALSRDLDSVVMR